MNKFFAKIAGITAGLALVASAGVALANHAEVKGVRAASDIEITFPGTPSQKTSAYTKTFTMTVSDVVFTFANWNNGSSSDSWDAIRGGQKSSAWTGTITSGAIANTVEKVVVNITQVANSTGSKLEVASDASFTTNLQTVNKGAITATGNAEFVVPNQVENSYYRLTFTQSAKSNGTIRVGGITYVAGTESGGDTYGVTYNKNDSTERPATGMPANISGLEDGETASLTGSPTRWGYTFLGWGASATATETISSVTIDAANETVYALWQEDHTVAGAWSDSPYTVAQAKAAIDASTNLANVYATGIISQVDSYNSTYHSITYWISADGTTTDQFQVYSGKGLDNANFSSVSDIEVGAEVVIYGTIKKYNSTYEFDKNNYQISYDAPSTGDIEVTFAPANFYGVGDSGTFSASTEAASPTYSFSSDNSSVISVTSAGAFEAVAAGSATVRVDVTSSEGNGYKEVAVTVVAVKTVSEAYEIAAGLASGATTDYSIKVSGWVSSLDADGKARAINFTDGAEVIEVFFGGGNADYTTVKNAAEIGSEVTVFGKVQNYSGTYELKDITLEGVHGSDAVGFAAGAYKSLDGSCETGVDAVTEDQWTAINNGFDAIDPSEQAKFQEEDVTSYGTNVVNWVARYEIIVAHSSLGDFMSRGVSAARVVPGTTAVDSNVAVAVVAIVAIASISAIAVVLVIKRRKALEK